MDSNYTLLDASRYNRDERGGSLTRRNIDGPGIGNFGAGDWGDSGKLGTDMILTPQWFWWNAPKPVQGVDWGEKWTFGSIGPGSGNTMAGNPTAQELNGVSFLYQYPLR